MKKLISMAVVTAVLLLSQNPVQAQEYADGYIIDKSGNRFNGTIFKAPNNQNFLRVIFRNAGNPNAAEQLTPVELESYSFLRGDTYESYLLAGESITGIRAGAIFLREIIPDISSMGLYLFKNHDGRNFYFLKENGEFSYLNRDTYKETLAGYTGGCEAHFKDKPVSKTGYRTIDLASFVNTYNSCKDPDYVVQTGYKSEGVFYTGIRAGSGFGLNQAESSSNHGPDFSLTLYGEYTISDRNSLQFEAGFIRRHASDRNRQIGDVALGDTLFEARVIDASSDLELNYAQINVMYKRTFRQDAYILGGLGFGFNIADSKIEGTAEVVNKPSVTSVPDEDLKVTDEYKLLELMPNITLGVGKEFNLGALRFSLESRLNISIITQDKPRFIYLTNEENATYYLFDGYSFNPFFLDFYLTVPFR